MSATSRECYGGQSGAEGNRTLDLLNAIQALSQLSYGPTGGKNPSGVTHIACRRWAVKLLGRRCAGGLVAARAHLRGCVRKKSSMSCVHSDGHRPWFSLPTV